MLSLQKSFEYQGNPAYLNNVNLKVTFPQFTYHLSNQNLSHANLNREIDAYESSEIIHKTTLDNYRIELPINKIIGENSISRYGFFRFHKIEPLGYQKIDSFSFPLKVEAMDEHGNAVQTFEFDAIYGVKSTPISDYRNYHGEIKLYDDTYGGDGQINDEQVNRLIKEEKNRLFLINKARYNDLFRKLNKLPMQVHKENYTYSFL